MTIFSLGHLCHLQPRPPLLTFHHTIIYLPQSATVGEQHHEFVEWSGAGASTLVQTMLPRHERTPTVLTRTIRTKSGPLRLCVGAAVSLTRERPGNGGFRLLTYENDESMAEECVGLAQGMEIKVRARVHVALERRINPS